MTDRFLNIEAEQQILGSILMGGDAYNRIGDILKPEHFGDPVHQRIFEICRSRISAGHGVSPVILRSIIGDDPGLKEIGGPAYLARLAGAAISPVAIKDYAALVIEDAARRALSSDLAGAEQALGEGLPPNEVTQRLYAALRALPEAVGRGSSQSLASAILGAVDGSVEVYQGKVKFLKTGMPALDAILRGLAPGDYCLLCGTTSMGKTACAVEIARHVAFSGSATVAFSSLEMMPDQIASRIASCISRIPYNSMREPDALSEDDFRKWISTAKKVGEGDMKIIPKHIRDIPAIHAACQRIQAEAPQDKPLSLVVIDYAQLVRGKGRGRYEQMTEVSIGLKTLAGMLGVPVIALCQLSRDIGSRDDKRPQLFDIKETGQFENDADQVVMCHREIYWLERQGPRLDKGRVTADTQLEWDTAVKGARNVMELIVRKNRHGRLGTARVGFHDATNRFWDLDQRDGPSPDSQEGLDF